MMLVLFLSNNTSCVWKINHHTPHSEKEKAELIQELGYDPDRDPMQDHWDHESDKIAIQQEFHDNETS